MANPNAQSAPSSYRWVVLGIATLVLAVAMGQLVNGFSVYFVPMEASEGWSRAEIAMINTSGLIGLAIGSLVMGYVAERIGVRPVAIMGILVIGTTTIAASRATELWHFYALYVLAGALGGGALAPPLMGLVGNWFDRGAGLAIGIASAGQAFGQGFVPFSGAWLIELMGWRASMLTQGVVTIAVLLPLAYFLRPAPRGPSSQILANETPSGLPNGLITVWLSAAVVGCCFCMAVPLMHLVPLIQGKGVSASNAGSVIFVMLMVAIVGRIAFGRLADQIGALPAYIIASAWQTILVFGFVFMEQLSSFYLYAVLYGFGYAGVMTSVLVTVRNISAPARRVSTLGVVLAFAYVGHGLGGWQGGYFYDLTANYTWSYANAALAGVINLVLLATLWMTINRRGAPVAA